MTTTEEVSEKAPSHSFSRHQEKENRPVLYSCYSLAGARDTNQDVAAFAQFTSQTPIPVTLGAVADGMGGYGNGEQAACVAISTLFARMCASILVEDLQNHEQATRNSLCRAFHSANEQVIAYGTCHQYTEGMGTTLVAVAVAGGSYHVGSVGDSRCYRWHDGTLQQLTRDDSFVQDLVDAELLTPEEAERHPRANQITKALGWPQDLAELTIVSRTIQNDELLILCSDGLWKEAGSTIRDTCRESCVSGMGQANLDALAARLVEGAIERGADDNVSVALVWLPCAEEIPDTQHQLQTREED